MLHTLVLLQQTNLIGLSKYTRIAQWCARRGTLQEELANDIAREIAYSTGAEHLGVYIQATHGCCENRGIMAHSSLNTNNCTTKVRLKKMQAQRKSSLTISNYNRSLAANGGSSF